MFEVCSLTNPYGKRLDHLNVQLLILKSSNNTSYSNKSVSPYYARPKFMLYFESRFYDMAKGQQNYIVNLGYQTNSRFNDLAEKQPKYRCIWICLTIIFFIVQSIKLISLHHLIPELYVFYSITMGKRITIATTETHYNVLPQYAQCI